MPSQKLIARHSGSPQLIELEERFVTLARVEEDWDSYGAAAVDPHAIAVAHTLIMDVIAAFPRRPVAGLVPTDVLPLPNGNVQVIWQGPEGELDLDVDAQGSIGYLLTIGAGPTRQREERDGVSPVEVQRVLGERIKL